MSTRRLAVVTGSSSGIGEAIADRLGATYDVIVNSRSADRAQEVADRLSASGGTFHPVAADVSRPDGVADLFAAVDRLGDSLAVLVNNAGIGLVGASEEFTLDNWQRVMDLNLTASFLCAQAAAQRMLPQRSGVIVNVASIAGKTALPKRAAYTASKHGLVGLTKALGAEWASRNVRVVGVSPAFIDTPLIRTARASGGFAEQAILDRTPLGRIGEAGEVADVVDFLCSDRAGYVTGTTVDIDGGWLADGGTRS